MEEYICNFCTAHLSYSEIDIKRWDDHLGNEEEDWFCPCCGANDIEELKEEGYED